MTAQEDEEVIHIRPACVECTHRCNLIHADQDMSEEKFDPDRSWPHFGRKLSKLALHHSPHAALCIPGAFSEEYPNSVPKGKPITLQGPSGNKWKVGATDRSVLHLGWRAFAHDHHLREGDQLHFRLTRPSHFVVDILNSHGEVRRSARKAFVSGKYGAPGSPPPLDDLQSRKRKVDQAVPPPIGNRADGTGAVAERWSKPAKRGTFNDPTAKLRFSQETNQWETQDEKDGRMDQVDTIDLGSDNDELEPPQPPSRLGMYVGFMTNEEEADPLTPLSKAFANQAGGEDPDVVDVDCRQDMNASGGEDDDVVQGTEPEKEPEPKNENELLGEEEKHRPRGAPLRQFSSIFNTMCLQASLDDALKQDCADFTADLAAYKAKMVQQEKVDSVSNQLSGRARKVFDDDVVVVKDEEENEDDDTHLVEPAELENIISQACVVKEETCTEAEQDAAADYESVTAHETIEASPVSSVKVKSEMHESTVYTNAEDGQLQKAAGGSSSGIPPENAFENPVIIDYVYEGEANSEHEIKPNLKRAGDEDGTEDDVQQHLTPCKSSFSVYEANGLHVAKEEPATETEEKPDLPAVRDIEKEIGLFLPSQITISEYSAPENEKSSIVQASVAATADSVVLKSKRGTVFEAEREKAIRDAHIWARKIRSPNYIAVMKTSHVYSDFVMDVPPEYKAQWKLPAKDARVTLVCDEVPTMCKAVWEGSKAQIDSKGWMNFSRSHFLEEGDVCVFESLASSASSVKLGVYIFRVHKLKRPIVLDWFRHYHVLQQPSLTSGKSP